MSFAYFHTRDTHMHVRVADGHMHMLLDACIEAFPSKVVILVDTCIEAFPSVFSSFPMMGPGGMQYVPGAQEAFRVCQSVLL